MFQIFKNGKKTVRKTFTKYDDARCYVRKLIRKTSPIYTPFCDLYSNPNLSEHGYSIRNVAS